MSKETQQSLPPSSSASHKEQAGGQQPTSTSSATNANSQLPTTKTPALRAGKVLKYNKDQLTEFEQGEVLDFQEIYYFGTNAGISAKIRGTTAAKSGHNHGYDDERLFGDNRNGNLAALKQPLTARQSSDYARPGSKGKGTSKTRSRNGAGFFWIDDQSRFAMTVLCFIR